MNDSPIRVNPRDSRAQSDPPGHTVTVHISNLTAKDANFLSQIISLFTDAERAAELAHLRTGQMVIRYSRPRGEALLLFPHQV